MGNFLKNDIIWSLLPKRLSWLVPGQQCAGPELEGSGEGVRCGPRRPGKALEAENQDGQDVGVTGRWGLYQAAELLCVARLPSVQRTPRLGS